MEKSDSIVMDPHKTLFLPYGLGAVLVRDVQKLYAAHHQDADYMQDTLAALEEASPADLSPELTRNFRGLRLWLPLKLVGVAPFRAAVEEKMLLARYFWQRLQEMEGFEVGPSPDLSVVVYRYVPKRGDANEFNQRLIQEMQKDGRVFLSSTNLDGRYTLRLAVVVFRTHLEDIELTLELLREKARLISSSL
jgi:glutamate/tyrosine decarboxylase-like PLP-dependent enzyme